MAHKALEFVVPKMLAIALGTVLSIGTVYLTAIYLTDRYLDPDQPETHDAVAGGH